MELPPRYPRQGTSFFSFFLFFSPDVIPPRLQGWTLYKLHRVPFPPPPPREARAPTALFSFLGPSLHDVSENLPRTETSTFLPPGFFFPSDDPHRTADFPSASAGTSRLLPFEKRSNSRKTFAFFCVVEKQYFFLPRTEAQALFSPFDGKEDFFLLYEPFFPPLIKERASAHWPPGNPPPPFLLSRIGATTVSLSHKDSSRTELPPPLSSRWPEKKCISSLFSFSFRRRIHPLSLPVLIEERTRGPPTLSILLAAEAPHSL